MKGLCSSFGGADDKTMAHDTGLAFYEPHEANERPDIFLPAPKNNPLEETWKRLRIDFPYIAVRIHNPAPRKVLQRIPWKITNLKTGDWEIAFLVDRGPGIMTRLVDLSPGLFARLSLTTDQMVEVEPLIAVEFNV